MRIPFTITLVFLLLCVPLIGQVTFEQGDNVIKANRFFSTLATGFTDINGDFQDDLLHLDRGTRLFTSIQNQPGLPFQTSDQIADLGDFSQWTLCASDIDNDGQCEIMVGGAYDGAKIYTRANGVDPYALGFTSTADFFAQGSNFVDINNDGWLDLFICDDDSASEIWINDQAGNLVRNNEFIDTNTVPVSDNSGNYGSEWVDFDSDGDVDLYISKCRQGVVDPTDPRRINLLYVNDGNGNFTELGADFGLDIADQSWTGTFGDLDNDGDLDAFVTNHDNLHGLYENIENDTFINRSLTSGIDLAGFALQGFLRDMDNNGLLDIVVSGGNDHIYYNLGSFVFTRDEIPFGGFDTHSLALGDANDDGFLDAYVNYGSGLVEVGNRGDDLWINQGNDNNFIKISLLGSTSNKSAIGTRLELYGPWGVQIRHVRAGEGYGVINSLNQIFGLGGVEAADSLIVKWPSGIVDRFNDLQAGESYLVNEGSCLTTFFETILDGNQFICEGDTVTISAPDASSYLWSTGATTKSITVSDPGIFHVSITDENGCLSVSKVIGIDTEPDLTPSIDFIDQKKACAGDSIGLISSESSNYNWSTGSNDNQVFVKEPGEYYVFTQGVCNAYYSDTIAVEFLDAIEPEVTPDTIFEDGNTAVLEATGDSVFWYDQMDASTPIFVGNMFETPALEESTTYYVENLQTFPGDSEFFGLENHQGGSLYSGNQFNAALVFDVFDTVTIKSVKVVTDTPGDRIIEIYRSTNELIYQDTFSVKEGESRLEIDYRIDPGTDYYITTNTGFNLQNFGFNSPRFQRDETNVDLPYTLEDKIEIHNTSFGFIFYYYFYDWEILEDDKICISDRVSVTAEVDTESSIEELPVNGSVSIFPNPVTDILHVKNERVGQSLELTIINHLKI